MTLGDSSVLHCASHTAHINLVIRRKRARIPRTRYCFSITTPFKGYDGLKFLNEYDNQHIA